MNLGETIYRLRTGKNMSQGDLADALEVSRQSVSKWENNAAVPELDKLQKMSQLFGVTLDELVNGTPPATSEPQPITVIYQTAPSKPMAANRIVGFVLLGLGVLAFVVLTLYGYFEGNIFLGLLSFPLFLDGIVCLLSEKHTVFSIVWVNFILFWIFNFMVLLSNAETAGFVLIGFGIATAAMVSWSLFKLHRGHFSIGKVGKILWTAVLIALLLLQGCLTIKGLSNPSPVRTEEFSESNQVIVE